MPVATGDTADGLRRVCIVAGTAEYESEDFERLGDVPKELALVQAALTTACGMTAAPGSTLNPTSGEFLDAVGGAVTGTSPDDRDAEPNPPDAAAVYYSGHGFHTDTDYCLATRSSKHRSDRDRDRDSITATELAREVMRQPGPPEVAVVVDACFAEAADAEFQRLREHILREDRNRPPVYLIAAASSTTTAQPMAFAEAFATALRCPGLPHSSAYIHPRALTEEINLRLPEDQRATLWMSKNWSLTCRVFPNPRHVKGILPIDLAAQGLVDGAPDMGWAFVGRRRAIGELVAHLSGTDPRDRLLLLTGRSGSGKSTLLAWLAAASRGTPLRTADRDAVGLVPLGCVTVIADALGEDPLSIAQYIAMRLTHRLPPDDVDACVEAVADHPEPVRIVIDAVDGAPDQPGMTDLLRKLAAVPTVRLVASTRSTVKEPGWVVLDLDDCDYFHPDDVKLLAATVLGGHAGSLHRDVPPPVLDGWAARVAECADGSFMHALLYACHLATQESTEVRVFMDEIFVSQLAALHPDDPRWGADLLRPLAFALRGGMPDYSLWIDLVRRLSDREVNHSDLDRIQVQAGHLIAESAGSEQTGGWRLQHEELAAHLRQGVDAEAVHKAFTEALRPGDTDTCGWAGAGHYARVNFAEHAMLARTLENHLDDPGFLLMADPARLRRALDLADSETARTTRAVYDGVRSREPSDGCELSRMALLAGARSRSLLASNATDLSERWTSRWDRAVRLPPAVSTVTLPAENAGHMVLASIDGSVRTHGAASSGWQTLLPAGEIVTALGGGWLQQQPVLTVGRWNGQLTLHHLKAGTGGELAPFDGSVIACPVLPYGVLAASDEEWQFISPGRTGPRVDTGGLVLQSAAATVVDDRVLVVGATADEVAVWQAGSGELLDSFASPSRRAIRLVAAHGRTLLTAGHEGAVYATDVTGGHHRLLVRHGQRPISSLRVVPDGAAPILVSASLDGTVCMTPLNGHGPRAMVDVGLEVRCADLDLAGHLIICTELGVARIAGWHTGL
ncbi:AAA family ATPase [Kitasatospora sp. KL5]|uniref:AAA family ATPase n=1 Tax=Kitasatospora sp. KL5 TaxID=3425125 RepID=UPI003D6F4BD7